MLRKLTWTAALVLDITGVLFGSWIAYSARGRDPLLVGGLAIAAIFGALTVALLVILGRSSIANLLRRRAVVGSLTAAVPLATFVGSLDAGKISGLEWWAVFAATSIAIVNWAALVAIRSRA